MARSEWGRGAPRRWGLAAAAAASACPGAAAAGAWSAPPGGREIWTTVDGVRGGQAFSENEIYLEQRIKPGWAGVAQPRVEFGPAYRSDQPNGWRGEAGVSLKRAVLERDGLALALQAGPTWSSGPAPGCAEGGAEARVLAGASRPEAFVSAEAALRAQGDGCARGRFDLTGGWRPRPLWLGLAQVFLDQDLEQGAAVKVQMSVVKFERSGAALQLGVRFRADSDGPGERALVISTWRGPRGRAKRNATDNSAVTF